MLSRLVKQWKASISQISCKCQAFDSYHKEVGKLTREHKKIDFKNEKKALSFFKTIKAWLYSKSINLNFFIFQLILNWKKDFKKLTMEFRLKDYRFMMYNVINSSRKQVAFGARLIALLLQRYDFVSSGK